MDSLPIFSGSSGPVPAMQLLSSPYVGSTFPEARAASCTFFTWASTSSSGTSSLTRENSSVKNYTDVSYCMCFISNFKLFSQRGMQVDLVTKCILNFQCSFFSLQVISSLKSGRRDSLPTYIKCFLHAQIKKKARRTVSLSFLGNITVAYNFNTS